MSIIGLMLIAIFFVVWVGIAVWLRQSKKQSITMAAAGGFLVGCVSFVLLGFIANSMKGSKGNESQTANAPQQVTAPVAADPYEGWKDYTFADGNFEVKYPAAKAHPMQASNYHSEFSCEPNGSSTACHFMMANMNLLTISVGSLADRNPSQEVDDVVKGIESAQKISKRDIVNVNGLEMTEIVSTPNDDINGIEQTRIYAGNGVLIALSGYAKKDAFSKEDIEKFLNSFSATKASTPAASPTTQIPADRTEWEQGINYFYASDGSCRDEGNTKCINLAAFEAACNSVKGVSQLALDTIAIVSGGDDRDLAKAGNFSNLSMTWTGNRCNVSIDATGVVNGTSKKASFFGNAVEFTLSNDGQLLARSVDWNH
jgi:hypothetical protein